MYSLKVYICGNQFLMNHVYLCCKAEQFNRGNQGIDSILVVASSGHLRNCKKLTLAKMWICKGGLRGQTLHQHKN